jgi:hypothetical protein
MDLNTAMIMGTVASSAFGLGIYFKTEISKATDKFTTLLTEHKNEDGVKFFDHALRLQRIELHNFNETHSGKNPDIMDPKN